jgi:hypothetical protein
LTRVLWLARTLPFPFNAGDKVYTGRLAEALAGAGAEIAFVGHAVDAPVIPMPRITWHPVQGGLKNNPRALLDTKPLVAARYATTAYRKKVSEMAASAWGAVVIDQYGMGWVLEQQRSFPGRPLLVFVTHDHEESVTRLQARDPSAGPFKRAYLLQNHVKTKWFERATANGCDLLTTITEADAALFSVTAPGKPRIVLAPGYSGNKLASRSIGASTPRAIVLFGSYRWSAKVANLRWFLQQADAVMSKAGIEIRIVGDIADEVHRELAAKHTSVRFTGYVAEPTAHLDVRLAVLAEPIGGGFKLKLLDYIFNRLPIATLEACASGIPLEIKQHMAVFPDIDSMLRSIIPMVDDITCLNQRQQEAFVAAQSAFHWSDRGKLFLSAIHNNLGEQVSC